jgi:tetratricopeptide (TPR) repeat protein
MPSKTRVVSLVLAGLVLLVAITSRVTAEPSKSAEPTPDEVTRVRGEVYSLLMRALMSQRRGEYRSAAGDIRKAIELRPEDPAVLIQGADLLERMGRLRDAEDLARQALEIDPDSTDALMFVADRAAARALGTSKPDAKSRAEAMQLYERLLELGAEDPEILRKLVGLRLQSGDQAGAILAARELIERRPGDRHAVGMLGQLLLDTGHPRKALRVLVTFTAAHPNDSPLLALAEELARDLDAWDVVAEVFDEHGGFEDRVVEAQRLRGQALLRLGRLEEATGALEQSLLLDPSDRTMRYHLGRTYRSLGRLGDAAAMATELIEEEAGDRAAQLLLAETLDDQGDVEGALQSYGEVVRLFAGDDSSPQSKMIREAVRRRMIMMHLSRDEQDDAERLLEQLEDPEAVEALQVRARAAGARGDWNEARQLARELRSAGELVAAAMIEAEGYLEGDRPGRAREVIAEAVNEGGPSARLHAVALYFEAERIDEGERLLREWVELEPDNADAHFQLGSFLYRIDRHEDSEGQMKEVFRVDPDHAQALNFLGYSYAERGIRLDQALEMIQRALEQDAWNGAYLDSLGWVYFQMERYDEARGPLEQAARTYPHDPTVLEHLGDVYAKVGERELALAAWSRAIDAGAADADALWAKIEVVEVAEKERQTAGQTAKPAPADGSALDPMDPYRWP